MVEADAFDAESGKDAPAPKAEPKKPVSTEKREEIKQGLTAPEANADELQIKALKQPKEFSKKILIVAGVINAVVIIFTMIMIWRTLDLTPLAYLIPSVAAEVATGTGFYYSKAKVENRIKLMRQYKVAPQEQHFSDNF